MSAHIQQRALGVCYYPEHWPEENWAKDATLMVETGIKWVRIGEFCWSRLEPAHGQYEFDWLDRAIKTLGEAGLRVILGTPTATPPRWMLDKWTDMLALGEEGQARKFGSRRHYCFSHLGYQKECANIVEVLAKRYGKNPYIAAWQIDNEYGCHATTISYSKNALAQFRHWLAQKYQNIAALNDAWGNVFWSMEYGQFSQIELPNQTVTEANPSQVMDFRRFSSDMVVRFNQVQTKILRSLTDRPLLHNYMGRITDFDHFALGKDLDIATWDSYPLGFLEDRSDRDDAHKAKYMRQGDPDFQAFHHDLYRAVGKGRWWVMEQQPGPVNWAPYNPAPLPGMVRLWAWEALAHGAEVVSFFRWRQAPFAQEQMHAGLLRPDGGATDALAEVAQIASDIEQAPNVDIKPAKVAIIFDYPSAWGWETQPQGKSFDYFALVFDFYTALRKLGLSIDIVASDRADLSAYSLVFAPGLVSPCDGMKAALEEFEGLAILGPRFAAKTPDMQIPVPLPPNIKGLDCMVESVESLRPGAKVELANGGAFVHWAEKLSGSAQVFEQTMSGAPAIMCNESIWYVAGWPDDQTLKHILEQACDRAGVPTKEMPEGLRLRDTKDHRYVFNYGAEPAEFEGKEVPKADFIRIKFPGQI